ncbi:MAG: hypothetical protein BJ554DRAFT_4872 [Olpidium bornovanus]|uniref:Uncharacterized protein n=1 Tax=Olpidium bornovanus TaxID=278681 RepID=A0A8H8DL91_9FUNG|nr:MAG: hypothetical protein BJ554DRAFT_4872 [Olpidium bornovanus]
MVCTVCGPDIRHFYANCPRIQEFSANDRHAAAAAAEAAPPGPFGTPVSEDNQEPTLSLASSSFFLRSRLFGLAIGAPGQDNKGKVMCAPVFDVRALAEQMRAAEVCAAVIQFTKENGVFKDVNISSYLKRFECAVRQWELSDDEYEDLTTALFRSSSNLSVVVFAA